MKRIVQWIGCWLLVLGSVGAWGQTTYDWLNTAPDANWRTGAAGARWDPGGLWDQPPYGRLRFNNNHQVIMTNNVPAPYDQFQVEFGANATTARTIGGNTLRFFDFGGTWPRIGNLSTANHTINLPIQVSDGSASAWGGLELVTNNGSLTIGGGINGTNKNVYIYGNNVAVSTARSVFLNSVISGSGFVNISQFGLLRYNANQTYTGQTQIDNGELWIESGGDISGGGGIFVGNTGQPGNVAKFWLSNPTGGTTFTRPITINIGDATTREIGGLNTSGTHTFSGEITHGSNNGLIITSLNSGGTLVVSGVISGTSPKPITYNGAGTIVISGNNTYVGANTINSGTLVRLGGNVQALGGGTTTTTILSGGVLDLNGFNLSNTKPLNLNGTGIAGSGALTNNPVVPTNVSYAGSINIGSSASIIATNGNMTLSGTNSTGGGANTVLTLGGAFGGTFRPNINLTTTGSRLVKEGNGIWELTGTAANGWVTEINGGVLRIGTVNSIPTTTVVTIANSSGATLDLNNLNQQIGSLAGGGTTGGAVTLGSGTLTIGGAATTTFSGAISGSGGLTKQGTGLQTLSGNNTYGGATTINAGDLIYNSAGALPNASNIVLAGGRMVMANTIPTAAFTPGTLTLGGTTNSEIVLGTSANAVTITFANSSAIGWIAGRRITIRNWSPTGNKNIFFTGSGLTADQLDVIDFDGYGLGAKFDGTTNRIIPRFIYVTQATGSGNFSAQASWLNNDNPTGTSCASNPATIVIQSGFTLTQDIDYDIIRIENNGTYRSNTFTITLCSGGSFVNNGTVDFTTAGGGTVVCVGTATFSGTAPSGNYGLNNLTLNAATTISTAPTIRGTLRLQTTTASVSAPVNYTCGSTLQYAIGAQRIRGNEWTTATSGAGYPGNVQITANTTLRYNEGGSTGAACGNLLIDVGSSLFADWGSGSASLQVLGNVTNSGSFSLGFSTGGDLFVGGNFTNTGTLNTNARALFLTGTGDQTLSGANLNEATGNTNRLPFLIVNKTTGIVNLNAPVNVGQLQMQNNAGSMQLNNHNLIVNTNPISVIGAPFSASKMMITNGLGQLIFAGIVDGLNTRVFPIGDGTNYTPITINITGSTGTNRTIGMRVVDAAVPNPPLNAPTAPTHYITRYWIPSSSGFTSISWNGTATYAAAGDVVGTADNIRFSVWHPAPENVWMDYGGAPVGQTLTGGTNLTDLNSLSSSAFITGRNAELKLFYRTIASGNWSNLAIWETGVDASFSPGAPAVVVPSALNSSRIIVQNGHTVNINVDATIDQCVIQTNAVLVKGAINLTINDGPGTDLEILNGGIFRHSGAPTATINGNGIVRTGGMIEVTNNSAGSNMYASSPNMIYETNAVFYWNINAIFTSTDVIYFPNADANTIPIFRTGPVGAPVGGSNPLVINGLLQADGNLNFVNAGTKTFRNGIVGSGHVIQRTFFGIGTASGAFIINGNSAQIGGSGDIALNASGLQISAGTVTLISNKRITDTLVATGGTFTVQSGATLNAQGFALTGSALYNQQAGATLITASADGVGNDPALTTGSIRLSGTKTFTAGANYTFSGIAAQTTGNLMGTTIGTLTINNPTTVTLTNTNHVASTLNLQAGTFRAGIVTTLQIAAGGTVNGTGGNVSTNSNGEGGTIAFLANGAVNGTPTLWNVTIGNSGGGVNFADNATIFNRFTINAAGAVNPNAPTYANGSTLVYNTGGTYDRSVEWGQATAGAAGFPWHVEVMGSTVVNTGTVVPPRLAISGDLTIGAATNNNELRMNSLAIPLEVAGNLTIGSSTSQGNRLTLSDAPGGDLILQGNFTRFRSLNFFDNEAYTGNRGRRIIFSGSTPSSIDVVDATPANRVQAFHHMVMNKTGGARVNVQVPLLMIEDALTFNPNGGIINTRYNFGPGSGDAPGLLVMRRPATVQGTPSSTAMVNGMMRKETRLSSLTGGPSAMNGTFSGDFTFPIGKTNPSVLFRPVQIADVAHGSVDTWYDAEFALEPTTDAPRSAFFLDFVKGIWANNRWEVSRGGGDGSSLARVGIFYQTAFDNWTPVFPQPNSAVAVATYQLGGWRFTKLVENFNDANPPYLEAVPEISPGAWVYSEPLSTFSPFSIGWAFWQLLPLPVTLHSFTATLQGGDGLLRWEIDDAKDLRHFELQHSTDGQRFATLATLPRQEATGYSYRHRMLSAGMHHYRLAIVEKDGRRHYSRIEMLQVGTQRTIISGLLHNPVVGGQAIVRLQSATAQSAQAVVIDMAGRVLLRQQVQLMAGANQVPLSMLPLPAGHYRLLFRTADGVEKVMPLLR